MKKLSSAILLVIVEMLMLSAESDSQDRTQAGRMVITQYGVVAAENLPQQARLDTRSRLVH
ncbi:MAG: hypothetical protein M1451_07450 [Acidobacteria bacterium]|nr:hypothetical protein [Acidobacteriota bacterium]